MKLRLFACLFSIALAASCGGDNGASGGGDGGGDVTGDGGSIDGDGGGNLVDGGGIPVPDGGFGGSCAADQPQCNNCIDDDNDGTIDAEDIECTGAIDNDEGSFATGIPGDNVSSSGKQDCFFDGNSGPGNDGCDSRHPCCVLTDSSQCPDTKFNAATQCGAVDQMCIDTCGGGSPTGCDCFGCCTICDGDTCVDITLNTAIAPECDADTLFDPNKCFLCTKVAECGGATCDDDPDDCILCPGQTEADLPASCNDVNECPNGNACSPTAECGASQYCSSGCCVNVID